MGVETMGFCQLCGSSGHDTGGHEQAVAGDDEKNEGLPERGAALTLEKPRSSSELLPAESTDQEVKPADGDEGVATEARPVTAGLSLGPESESSLISHENTVEQPKEIKDPEIEKLDRMKEEGEPADAEAVDKALEVIFLERSGEDLTVVEVNQVAKAYTYLSDGGRVSSWDGTPQRKLESALSNWFVQQIDTEQSLVDMDLSDEAKSFAVDVVVNMSNRAKDNEKAKFYYDMAIDLSKKS